MSKLLTDEDFLRVSDSLGIRVAAVKAVAEVESAGSGFNDDGTPKILFEGHKFSQFTGGRFDLSNPTISYPKWTKRYYARTGAGEHARLQEATALNRNAGLQCASWGKFQIMGFNFDLCGFEDIQSFVNAMYESEGRHLDAFAGFVKSKGLVRYLNAEDWAGFALRYNGPKFKDNKYDKKLSDAYKKYGWE